MREEKKRFSPGFVDYRPVRYLQASYHGTYTDHDGNVWAAWRPTGWDWSAWWRLEPVTGKNRYKRAQMAYDPGYGIGKVIHLQRTGRAAELFSPFGEFLGDIPVECINECAAPGIVDSAVKYWREQLAFEVPRNLTIEWAMEYGSHSEQELKAMDDIELAELVLWLACGDLKEQGEWLGLVH